MKYPVISDDPAIQKAYIQMRKRGESHNMAEMCALQAAPAASGTDNQFWAGKHYNSEFEKSPAGQQIGKFYKRRAERLAPGCTSGAFYSRGCARFPGDPLGWVKNRSDVIRAAKAKGCDVDGQVKFKAPERNVPLPVPLAPDIVRQHVEQRVAMDPSLATKKREVAEQVMWEKTPHWKRNQIEPYLKQRRNRKRGRTNR